MSNQIKRHFYKNKDYIIDRVNKKVILTPDFFEKLKNKKLWGRFGFKKIGGSSIGDVLLVDSYKSQFAAFCRMSWIGLPILDRKYVDAGIAIEPKVISLIEEVTQKSIQTFDAHEYEFDYFSDKDDVVGGIPDGYIKETNTILEIKTTGHKNLEKWNNYSVPAAYQKQAQLYAYLMNADSFSIVATFLQEQDYSNPEKYPIKERKTKNWNFKINRNQAMDDIKKVKDWYQKYTLNGESPQYDEKLDAELLEWLDVENSIEWETLKEKWIQEGKLIV